MMKRGAVALVLSFIVACAILPENTADGEACKEDRDCDSKSCIAGYCERECAGESDNCQKGWTCKKYVQDNLFGRGSSTNYQCVPHCGACPSNKYCPPEYKPTDECIGRPYGPSARLADPGGLTLGTPVKLTAQILSTTDPITKYRWDWGDSLDPGVETTTPEVTHTFMGNQNPRVSLTVTDSKGATGTHSVELKLGCALERAACALPVDTHGRGASCCAEGMLCVTDHTCQRVPEMTATIAGPDFAEVGKPFSLTVSVQNQHSPVTIDWKWEHENLTTKEHTQSFTLTNSFEIDDKVKFTATVRDDLPRVAAASKEVQLCLGAEASCSRANGPYCCPGTHCTKEFPTKCVVD